MKVFEVGLICEFEGGGRRVLMADNDRLFANAKMYLLGAVDKHSEEMEVLYGDADDEFSKKYADECQQQLAAIRRESSNARDNLNNSKSMDDLRKIRMGESSLMVIVDEREVLGGAK